MAPRAGLVLLHLIPFFTNIDAIPLRALRSSSPSTTPLFSQCLPTPQPRVYGVDRVETLPSGTSITTFPGADLSCCDWHMIEKTDSACDNIISPTAAGSAVDIANLVSLNTGLASDCSNIQDYGYAPSQGVALCLSAAATSVPTTSPDSSSNGQIIFPRAGPVCTSNLCLTAITAVGFLTCNRFMTGVISSVPGVSFVCGSAAQISSACSCVIYSATVTQSSSSSSRTTSSSFVVVVTTTSTSSAPTTSSTWITTSTTSIPSPTSSIQGSTSSTAITVTSSSSQSSMLSFSSTVSPSSSSTSPSTTTTSSQISSTVSPSSSTTSFQSTSSTVNPSMSPTPAQSISSTIRPSSSSASVQSTSTSSQSGFSQASSGIILSATASVGLTTSISISPSLNISLPSVSISLSNPGLPGIPGLVGSTGSTQSSISSQTSVSAVSSASQQTTPSQIPSSSQTPSVSSVSLQGSSSSSSAVSLSTQASISSSPVVVPSSSSQTISGSSNLPSSTPHTSTSSQLSSSPSSSPLVSSSSALVFLSVFSADGGLSLPSLGLPGLTLLPSSTSSSSLQATSSSTSLVSTSVQILSSSSQASAVSSSSSTQISLSSSPSLVLSSNSLASVSSSVSLSAPGGLSISLPSLRLPGLTLFTSTTSNSSLQATSSSSFSVQVLLSPSQASIGSSSSSSLASSSSFSPSSSVSSNPGGLSLSLPEILGLSVLSSLLPSSSTDQEDSTTSQTSQLSTSSTSQAASVTSSASGSSPELNLPLTPSLSLSLGLPSLSSKSPPLPLTPSQITLSTLITLTSGQGSSSAVTSQSSSASSVTSQGSATTTSNGGFLGGLQQGLSSVLSLFSPSISSSVSMTPSTTSSVSQSSIGNSVQSSSSGVPIDPLDPVVSAVSPLLQGLSITSSSQISTQLSSRGVTQSSQSSSSHSSSSVAAVNSLDPVISVVSPLLQASSITSASQSSTQPISSSQASTTTSATQANLLDSIFSGLQPPLSASSFSNQSPTSTISPTPSSSLIAQNSESSTSLSNDGFGLEQLQSLSRPLSLPSLSISVPVLSTFSSTLSLEILSFTSLQPVSVSSVSNPQANQVSTLSSNAQGLGLDLPSLSVQSISIPNLSISLPSLSLSISVLSVTSVQPASVTSLSDTQANLVSISSPSNAQGLGFGLPIISLGSISVLSNSDLLGSFGLPLSIISITSLPFLQIPSLTALEPLPAVQTIFSNNDSPYSSGLTTVIPSITNLPSSLQTPSPTALNLLSSLQPIFSNSDVLDSSGIDLSIPLVSSLTSLRTSFPTLIPSSAVRSIFSNGMLGSSGLPLSIPSIASLQDLEVPSLTTLASLPSSFSQGSIAQQAATTSQGNTGPDAHTNPLDLPALSIPSLSSIPLSIPGVDLPALSPSPPAMSVVSISSVTLQQISASEPQLSLSIPPISTNLPAPALPSMPNAPDVTSTADNGAASFIQPSTNAGLRFPELSLPPLPLAIPSVTLVDIPLTFQALDLTRSQNAPKLPSIQIAAPSLSLKLPAALQTNPRSLSQVLQAVPSLSLALPDALQTDPLSLSQILQAVSSTSLALTHALPTDLLSLSQLLPEFSQAPSISFDIPQVTLPPVQAALSSILSSVLDSISELNPPSTRLNLKQVTMSSDFAALPSISLPSLSLTLPGPSNLSISVPDMSLDLPQVTSSSNQAAAPTDYIPHLNLSLPAVLFPSILAPLSLDLSRVTVPAVQAAAPSIPVHSLSLENQLTSLDLNAGSLPSLRLGNTLPSLSLDSGLLPSVSLDSSFTSISLEIPSLSFDAPSIPLPSLSSARPTLSLNIPTGIIQSADQPSESVPTGLLSQPSESDLSLGSFTTLQALLHPLAQPSPAPPSINLSPVDLLSSTLGPTSFLNFAPSTILPTFAASSFANLELPSQLSFSILPVALPSSGFVTSIIPNPPTQSLPNDPGPSQGLPNFSLSQVAVPTAFPSTGNLLTSVAQASINFLPSGLSFPSVALPSLENQLPSVTAPSVAFPFLDIPESSTAQSSISLPFIESPSIGLDLPSIAAPSLILPSVRGPSITLPNIGQPTWTLPSLVLPSLDLPAQQSLALPSLGLPLLNVPTITVPTDLSDALPTGLNIPQTPSIAPGAVANVGPEIIQLTDQPTFALPSILSQATDVNIPQISQLQNTLAWSIFDSSPTGLNALSHGSLPSNMPVAAPSVDIPPFSQLQNTISDAISSLPTNTPVAAPSVDISPFSQLENTVSNVIGSLPSNIAEVISSVNLSPPASLPSGLAGALPSVVSPLIIGSLASSILPDQAPPLQRSLSNVVGGAVSTGLAAPDFPQAPDATATSLLNNGIPTFPQPSLPTQDPYLSSLSEFLTGIGVQVGPTGFIISTMSALSEIGQGALPTSLNSPSAQSSSLLSQVTPLSDPLQQSLPSTINAIQGAVTTEITPVPQLAALSFELPSIPSYSAPQGGAPSVGLPNVPSIPLLQIAVQSLELLALQTLSQPPVAIQTHEQPAIPTSSSPQAIQTFGLPPLPTISQQRSAFLSNVLQPPTSASGPQGAVQSGFNLPEFSSILIQQGAQSSNYNSLGISLLSLPVNSLRLGVQTAASDLQLLNNIVSSLGEYTFTYQVPISSATPTDLGVEPLLPLNVLPTVFPTSNDAVNLLSAVVSTLAGYTFTYSIPVATATNPDVFPISLQSRNSLQADPTFNLALPSLPNLISTLSGYTFTYPAQVNGAKPTNIPTDPPPFALPTNESDLDPAVPSWTNNIQTIAGFTSTYPSAIALPTLVTLPSLSLPDMLSSLTGALGPLIETFPSAVQPAAQQSNSGSILTIALNLPDPLPTISEVLGSLETLSRVPYSAGQQVSGTPNPSLSPQNQNDPLLISSLLPDLTIDSQISSDLGGFHVPSPPIHGKEPPSLPTISLDPGALTSGVPSNLATFLNPGGSSLTTITQGALQSLPTTSHDPVALPSGLQSNPASILNPGGNPPTNLPQGALTSLPNILIDPVAVPTGFSSNLASILNPTSIFHKNAQSLTNLPQGFLRSITPQTLPNVIQLTNVPEQLSLLFHSSIFGLGDPAQLTSLLLSSVVPSGLPFSPISGGDHAQITSSPAQITDVPAQTTGLPAQSTGLSVQNTGLPDPITGLPDLALPSITSQPTFFTVRGAGIIQLSGLSNDPLSALISLLSQPQPTSSLTGVSPAAQTAVPAQLSGLPVLNPPPLAPISFSGNPEENLLSFISNDPLTLGSLSNGIPIQQTGLPSGSPPTVNPVQISSLLGGAETLPTIATPHRSFQSLSSSSLQDNFPSLNLGLVSSLLGAAAPLPFITISSGSSPSLGPGSSQNSAPSLDPGLLSSWARGAMSLSFTAGTFPSLPSLSLGPPLNNGPSLDPGLISSLLAGAAVLPSVTAPFLGGQSLEPGLMSNLLGEAASLPSLTTITHIFPSANPTSIHNIGAALPDSPANLLSSFVPVVNSIIGALPSKTSIPSVGEVLSLFLPVLVQPPAVPTGRPSNIDGFQPKATTSSSSGMNNPSSNNPDGLAYLGFVNTSPGQGQSSYIFLLVLPNGTVSTTPSCSSASLFSIGTDGELLSGGLSAFATDADMAAGFSLFRFGQKSRNHYTGGFRAAGNSLIWVQSLFPALGAIFGVPNTGTGALVVGYNGFGSFPLGPSGYVQKSLLLFYPGSASTASAGCPAGNGGFPPDAAQNYPTQTPTPTRAHHEHLATTTVYTTMFHTVSACPATVHYCSTGAVSVDVVPVYSTAVSGGQGHDHSGGRHAEAIGVLVTFLVDVYVEVEIVKRDVDVTKYTTSTIASDTQILYNQATAGQPCYACELSSQGFILPTSGVTMSRHLTRSSPTGLQPTLHVQYQICPTCNPVTLMVDFASQASSALRPRAVETTPASLKASSKQSSPNQDQGLSSSAGADSDTLSQVLKATTTIHLGTSTVHSTATKHFTSSLGSSNTTLHPSTPIIRSSNTSLHSSTIIDALATSTKGAASRLIGEMSRTALAICLIITLILFGY